MHLTFPSLNRPILAALAARARPRLYQDHDFVRQRRPGSQHFPTLTTRITTFLGAVDEVRPFSPAALARARATTENRTRARGRRGAWRSSAVAELFAGVGDFVVGLDALGGRRVFACEIEGQARGCYEANFGFPLARDVRDVKGVDVPEHELLTAGFPCQPFSREGTQPGLEHRLGLLFAEIVRLLVASRPAMFLLENVPGLLSAQGGGGGARRPDWCGVRRPLARRGRRRPAAADCPRRRVWLAGFRGAGRGRGFKLKQPLPTLTRNYRKAPGAAAAAKCVAATERFAAVAVEVAALAEVEAVAELAAIADRSASADDDGDDGDDGDQDSTGRPRAGRRNLIGVEHDGDAGMVQPPPRFLTPRECARVQGFPEYFKLPQNGAPNGPSATLFGNVVSPPIVDDEDARLCEASKAEVDTARSGVAEGDVLCAAMSCRHPDGISILRVVSVPCRSNHYLDHPLGTQPTIRVTNNADSGKSI